MISLFKLIRLPNLIMVVATQYLMRYAVINSILQFYNNHSEDEVFFQLQMSDWNFGILVFATVLLTAAGYVINDYFDTKTDLLNRPETMVVGKAISRRQAMRLHLVFNVIGILSGTYVAWKIGHLKFGLLFVLISGVLWFYSTTYKRQLLIGNIIVALLTAMVPLIVALFELPMLHKSYSDVLLQYNQTLMPIFLWVAAFAYFAFLTTLIREIIKDFEDFEGDAAYGRNTLPIVWGTKISKITVISLIALVIFSIVFVFVKFLKQSELSMWYLIVTQLIPLIFVIIKVAFAKNKKDYSISSLAMKIIMGFGVFYSLIAAYIFVNM